MSLFLKIFLWFWLATALIIGAVLIVNWSTQTQPLARQWQRFFGNAIERNSLTAIQIYENEGVGGLKEYFARQTSRRRINFIGLFDRKGDLIAGNFKREDIKVIFGEALTSGKTEFHRTRLSVTGVKSIVLKDGKTYVYAIDLRRFRSPPFFTSGFLLRGLVVFLVAGLVCYALARYLSSPISRLRAATQRFAAGDLQIRVGKKTGNRRDELSNLAKDFDNMAETIESLISSEKRLTQDISHELRSPLARINVALELARKKSNSETTQMLDRIEKESGRLNDLISQLLTLSKLETGSHAFEKTRISFTKLIEKTVSDANFEAHAQNKTVDILKADQVNGVGNENLLRRAIENVLRNAVRHTKEGTAVEVTIEEKSGKAVIGIKDCGGGAPNEELKRLFKPFYRVEEARDRKSGGTGLGLAIAESAVKNHEGEISAKNVEDGLLVTIQLPIIND